MPEGLPLAVTLALAFATKRMTKHNLLVRVFESCEIMANATVIVTDKTGTLTQNMMKTVALCIGDIQFIEHDITESAQPQESPEVDRLNGHADASDYFSSGKKQKNRVQEEKKLSQISETLSDKLKSVLMSSIAVNSTAFEETEEGSDETDFVGSKTETALLRLLKDLDWEDCESLRNSADIGKVFPFSSDRKAMATVIKEDGKARLLVKGAAEVLLKQCKSSVKVTGTDEIETVDIGDSLRQQLEGIMTQYQDNALRTLALCYRDLEGQGDDMAWEDVTKDLVLLAITGIEDPLRKTVTESVKQCHQAGLTVIMCTGDNLLTGQYVFASPG